MRMSRGYAAWSQSANTSHWSILLGGIGGQSQESQESQEPQHTPSCAAGKATPTAVCVQMEAIGRGLPTCLHSGGFTNFQDKRACFCTPQNPSPSMATLPS